MDVDSILRKYSLLDTEINCESKCLAVIKSNLMFKCKEIAAEERLELDTGSLCCKWCMNSWKPGQYSVLLQPQIHPKGRIRSLLNKDITLLNKFQLKLVQRIKQKSSANTLVFKCHICDKNTKVPLRKIPVESQVEEIDLEHIEESKKKKRKKKKDLYAGLNPAVLQNYVKVAENTPNKPSTPAKYSSKKHKPDKKLTLQKQIRIHQELMHSPQLQKKHKEKSILSSFLDTMS